MRRRTKCVILRPRWRSGWRKWCSPKDPFVCPKNPGFPLTNPMTWEWDWDQQSYSIGRSLDSIRRGLKKNSTQFLFLLSPCIDAVPQKKITKWVILSFHWISTMDLKSLVTQENMFACHCTCILLQNMQEYDVYIYIGIGIGRITLTCYALVITSPYSTSSTLKPANKY